MEGVFYKQKLSGILGSELEKLWSEMLDSCCQSLLAILVYRSHGLAQYKEASSVPMR